MIKTMTRLSLCQRFVSDVKHSVLLGMEVLDATEKGVCMRLPWREDLVGDPETGILHGGAVFAFMDQAGGLAGACEIFPDLEITPTIDMRVDHLRAPDKGKTIICEAECYRKSRQVLFVRMTVYEDGNKQELVATGLATYMRMKLPTRQSRENQHA
jgi:uncharacterized protein (TIGR00369 family)